MSRAPRSALHLLLWLLLLGLPYAADAHNGSHGITPSPANPQVTATRDGVDAASSRFVARVAPANEIRLSSSHCPTGDGAACCCAQPWLGTSALPKLPAATGVRLAQPDAPRNAATARNRDVPVAAAALLIHLTGPRAPPVFL